MTPPPFSNHHSTPWTFSSSQFSSGNQEQPGRLPPVSSFHVETETVAAASQGPMGPAGQKGRPAQGGRQAVGRTASGPLAMEEEEEEEEEEGDTSRR